VQDVIPRIHSLDGSGRLPRLPAEHSTYKLPKTAGGREDVVVEALFHDSTKRHDSLFGSFATNMEVAARQGIADSQIDDFREPKSCVEQQENDEPVGGAGGAEKAFDVGLIERGNDPVRSSRPLDPVPRILLEPIS
jgi:hypothetical protein